MRLGVILRVLYSMPAIFPRWHANNCCILLITKSRDITQKKILSGTRQSLLEVDIMESRLVFMEQPLPVFYNVIPAQEISECLNISLDVIKTNLPIQIVSTGVRDIFISY